MATSSDDRKAYLRNIAQTAQSFGWVPIAILGKIPRFRNWQNVRIDPQDPGKRIRHIEHLYDAGLANNVGVLTGSASGIVVLDIDKGSVEWFNQYVRKKSPTQAIPETFIVQTGNDGLHIYFRYTPELSDIGNLNKIKGQNIDYRTNGGMAIFPGSVHPETGKSYLVALGYVNNRPIIADMPKFLVDLLRQDQAEKQKR